MSVIELRGRDALQHLADYQPGKSVPGVIKLSSNENPYPPPWFVRRAVRRAARRINRYPHSHNREVAEGIAQRHGMDGAHVVLGNGSDELMQLIAYAFMEQGDEGIVMEHTFSIYRHSIIAAGGVPRVASMHDGKLRVDALPAHIGARTKVIFLCSPNNPTGSYLPQKELEWIVQQVPPSVALVIDQAYGEFATAADYCPAERLIAHHPNVVVLGTLSKLYGLAGARIGYALAASPIASLLNKLRLPFNINSCAAEVAQVVLRHAGYYRRLRDTICVGREWMRERAQNMGYAPLPSEANFLTLPVVPDALTCSQRLQERGIIVRPLNSFGLPQHIRITIGRPHENRRAAHALGAVNAGA